MRLNEYGSCVLAALAHDRPLSKAVLATQLQSVSIQRRHDCRLPGLVECFAHEMLAMLLMVVLLMVLRPQQRLRPSRLG